MMFAFRRRLFVPVWAVAFFAIALTGPTGISPVITLLGLGLIAVAVPALARRMVSAGTCARPLAPATRVPAPEDEPDALNLVRMDDDGGWQIPLPRGPALAVSGGRRQRG
jgi:hypothetical protein